MAKNGTNVVFDKVDYFLFILQRDLDYVFSGYKGYNSNPQNKVLFKEVMAFLLSQSAADYYHNKRFSEEFIRHVVREAVSVTPPQDLVLCYNFLEQAFPEAEVKAKNSLVVPAIHNVLEQYRADLESLKTQNSDLAAVILSNEKVAAEYHLILTNFFFNLVNTMKVVIFHFAKAMFEVEQETAMEEVARQFANNELDLRSFLNLKQAKKEHPDVNFLSLENAARPFKVWLVEEQG